MDKMSLIAIAKASQSGGGGSFTQQQADWNQTDNTQVDYIKNKPNLASVATSGSYSDLSNTPVLATVATSGDYDDLLNKPSEYTLPTASTSTLGGVMVDNDTITIDDGVISAVMPTIDTELDSSSANAISNSAVTTALDDMSDDISDMEEYVDNATQGYTISTTPYITDASNTNIPSLVGDIEPIQDLHGYSYPWAGGAGKNLLDADNVTMTGTANTNTTQAIGSINLVEGVTYAISYTQDVTLTTVARNTLYLDFDGQTVYQTTESNANLTQGRKIWIYTATYTGEHGVVMWCHTPNITVTYSLFMIELGSQATSFAPYSNICPISGYDEVNVSRCGKNLLPMTISNIKSANTSGTWSGNVYTYNGVIFELLVDSANNITGIKVSGTATASIFFAVSTLYTLSANTDYILSGCTGGSIDTYFFYDSSRDGTNFYQYNDERTITGTGGTSAGIIYINSGYTANNLVFKPMIRLATISDPTYQPYQGTSITATFDNTVYSGTLDITTGMLTVDKAMVDLGDLTWTYQSNIQRFYTSITDLKNVGNVYANDVICSSYKVVDEATDKAIGHYANLILAWNSDYTDATAFKTAMDGVQLLYELATPITLHLTPQELKTLKGTNNFTTNLGGGLTITYQPDNVIGETKAYTEKLNELTNAKYDADLRGTQVSETEGQVITIDECAECYAECVSVDIEPIQDLHGYDYPWVGGANINLIPTGTNTSNGYVASNCLRSDGTLSSTGNYYVSEYFPVVAEEVYSWCLYPNATDQISVCFYDSSKNYISGYSMSGGHVVITTPLNAVYARASGQVLTSYETASYKTLFCKGATKPTEWTPYSNICPISGYDEVSVERTGKNLLPMTVENIKSTNTTGTWSGNTYSYRNVTFELLTDDANNVTGIKINTTGASGGVELSVSSFTGGSYNDNLPNGEYIISGDNVVINSVVNGSYSGGYTNTTFSVTNDNKVGSCYIYVSTNQPMDNVIIYPMIRLSTVSDSTYQPYQGTSITATFDNTVYSGHIDWISGECVLDMGMVDLGDLNYTLVPYAGVNYFVTTGISHVARIPTSNTQTPNIISSQYRTVARDSITQASNGVITLDANGNIDIVDNRYADASIKTAVTGVQLLYELATPQTIQFTPQQLQMLKGYNTVTTDANGGMVIKWQPDNVVGEVKAYASKLYEDLLERLEEAEG